ncbi:hypothetical protein KC717_02330 [Candidatus Dojkabacteria bacterium]|uniref:Uncharacterized protein n=1 Tax=Candidatus Dojkabacteria bacterium TaxID=2099670 RepID=A0A955RK33_9BACT|nr:hypothetical protein [Candidatus Dojkabacteria bacterium]
MNPNEKDQNVLSFMMQLVQQKHGDEVEYDFLQTEANKLYDTFGDNLVDYFEPMLTEEQKKQFDSMIDSNAQQDSILEFLMSAIPELDVKIQQVLINFRDSYLSSDS